MPNILSFIFLQSVEVAGAAEEAITRTADPVPVELSAFDLLIKGGWIILPIVILLLMAIYFFAERFMTIRRLGKVDQGLFTGVVSALQRGDIQTATTLCKGSKDYLARILERGLLRIGAPISEIEAGMESAAKGAITQLEKNMSTLGAISTLAPLFGFLGTVIGMIAVFTQIAFSNDNLSISTIADGMYVKMVSSAAGLVVGILAHIAHLYINAMIDSTVGKLENASSEFVDLLYTPQR